MSLRRLEELLWQRIDGEIEESDDERLDEMLAEQPEARERQRAVGALASMLDQVEELEPPAELEAGLLERLREPLPRVLPFAPPARPSASPARNWGMRISYLAAGFLVGVLAMRLVIPAMEERGAIDTSQVTATMSTDIGPGPSHGTRLDLGSVQGELQLWREADRVVAELQLEEMGPVELKLEREGGRLELHEARRQGGRTSSVTSAGHEASLSVTGGGNHRLVVGVGEGDAIESVVLLVRVHGPGHQAGQNRVLVGELPESTGPSSNF